MSLPFYPIRAAARDGRLEEVRRITEEEEGEGPSDGATPAGWTAVQWAALRGRTEVVLYLLGAGGREAEWDTDKVVRDVGMLWDAYDGVEVQTRSPVHGSPLCLASLRGHEETVRALLRAGAGGCVEEGAGGRFGTALSHAARCGHVGVVSALLAAGADVNAANLNGWTALLHASREGRADVSKALLGAGANANAASANGWTALMSASREGRADEAKALLAAGADVNATRVDGWTALMFASQSTSVGVAQALLAAGAVVNAADASGGTALMYASRSGHAGVVQALLAATAAVNAADANGWTALMFAARNGHAGAAQALLAAGAHVNAADALGWTALMHASRKGAHPSVVQALLAAGADVDATLPVGFTALYFACSLGSRLAAAVLVRHGAAVTPRIVEGCRSLAMAEALVIRGGARVTEALAAAAPTEIVRSFLEAWLAGTHPVQAERREAEEALLAARWGSAGGEYFPAELVSIMGEYVHARERRLRESSSSPEAAAKRHRTE